LLDRDSHKTIQQPFYAVEPNSTTPVYWMQVGEQWTQCEQAPTYNYWTEEAEQGQDYEEYEADSSGNSDEEEPVDMSETAGMAASPCHSAEGASRMGLTDRVVRASKTTSAQRSSAPAVVDPLCCAALARLRNFTMPGRSFDQL
jgi:hypothetical protein